MHGDTGLSASGEAGTGRALNHLGWCHGRERSWSGPGEREAVSRARRGRGRWAMLAWRETGRGTGLSARAQGERATRGAMNGSAGAWAWAAVKRARERLAGGVQWQGRSNARDRSGLRERARCGSVGRVQHGPERALEGRELASGPGERRELATGFAGPGEEGESWARGGERKRADRAGFGLLLGWFLVLGFLFISPFLNLILFPISISNSNNSI